MFSSTPVTCTLLNFFIFEIKSSIGNTLELIRNILMILN
jgi:hypothetical protein